MSTWLGAWQVPECKRADTKCLGQGPGMFSGSGSPIFLVIFFKDTLIGSTAWLLRVQTLKPDEPQIPCSWGRGEGASLPQLGDPEQVAGQSLVSLLNEDSSQPWLTYRVNLS